MYTFLGNTLYFQPYSILLVSVYIYKKWLDITFL